MPQAAAVRRDAVLTAVDLAERLGPVPMSRIRHDPPAGLGSEADVAAIFECEGRLYELCDGVLVEKILSELDARLASQVAERLEEFVADESLGQVRREYGLFRFGPGLVRAPDVSFVEERRWAEVAADGPILNITPDLAVEIISLGNTGEEMLRKLSDYMDGGTRMVWYIYPATMQVHVFTAPERLTTLNEPDTLDGGDVLPGFRLPLHELFSQTR